MNLSGRKQIILPKRHILQLSVENRPAAARPVQGGTKHFSESSVNAPRPTDKRCKVDRNEWRRHGDLPLWHCAGPAGWNARLSWALSGVTLPLPRCHGEEGSGRKECGQDPSEPGQGWTWQLWGSLYGKSRVITPDQVGWQEAPITVPGPVLSTQELAAFPSWSIYMVCLFVYFFLPYCESNLIITI